MFVIIATPVVNGKKLCATIDFKDNIWKSYRADNSSFGGGIHSTRNILEMLKIFKDLGIREVFWIYNFNDHKKIRIRCSKSNKMLTYNDFLKFLTKSAHNLDMKIFAVFKPFESASSAGLPQPYFQEYKNNSIENINGYFPDLDDFIVKNPQFRIKRKPVNKKLLLLPVSQIKLVSSNSKKLTFNKNDFILYTSSENGNFKPYSRNYDLQGNIETRKGKSFYVISFNNLTIPSNQKYIWIEYRGTNHSRTFYNQQNKMLELYHRGTKLPCLNAVSKVSVSSIYSKRDHLRATSVDRNGKEWKIKIPKDYGKNGNVAFSYGYGPWIKRVYLDSKNKGLNGYIAVCRGKIEFLNGLHPAYPQVREYWLQHIKKLIKCGFDGIDIRPDSHSTWTQEGENYGFNEPVMNEFRERYNVDVLKNKFNQKKWQDLQAEYFTKFLKAAKKETKKARVKLLIHVSHLMVNYFPRKLNNLPENFSWPWKDWIKNDLVDCITLKYFPWPWGKKRGEGKKLVEPIARFAKEYHKEVYLNTRLECWWLELSPEQRNVFPLKDKDIKRVKDLIDWSWKCQFVDAINLYEVNDFILYNPKSKKVSCSIEFKKILSDLRSK